MNDKAFLQWIHDRLVMVHHENEFVDFLWRLRAIIDATSPDQMSFQPITPTQPA